jgi:hypothetical protein
MMVFAGAPRAGGPRLYLPKWTDQILKEVSRNLQQNFGVTAERLTARGRSANTSGKLG